MYSAPQRWFIDDLVPVILESDDHWWACDLLRLARISSAWVGPVRRRLYTCPTLYSFHSCSLLARTLSGNKYLSSLLRGLDVRPTFTGDDRRPVTSDELEGLRFILALEGLRSITLGGELAVRAERFLHAITSPDTVEYLHIDGSLLKHSFSSFPSLEWNEMTALMFSSLRKLKLSHLELDIVCPTMPHELALNELLLDHVQIASGFLPHLLHENSALQCLRVWTSDAIEFNEYIRLLLQSCSIETLPYEVEGDFSCRQPIFGEESSASSSLRALHLGGLQIDLGTLISISHYCPNVEQLFISGRLAKVSPNEWAMFLASGALPLLRDLGIPWGTNDPPFRRWSLTCGNPVVEASALRNIRLVSGC